MLENIFIKNVALIKEVNLDLGEGLNIISGETGAGKSMFIDSINFMLGGKASKDFIRHGEESAEVNGTFYIENSIILDELVKREIEILEDNVMQIKRVVNLKNKSTIKINGKVVNIGVLKEIAPMLMDIHVQHEHQRLLSQSKHIEFLDILCGEEIVTKKNELSLLYKDFKDVEKKLDQLLLGEKEKNIKIDNLKFQLEELESADLQEDEETYLETRQKILSQSEKIRLNSEKIVAALYNNDDDYSAYDQLTESISLLEVIVEADSEKNYMLESLIDIQSTFEDIAHELRSFTDNLELEPNELSIVEERLGVIFKLKKKYGNTVEEILAYYNKIKLEFEELDNSDFNIKKLEKEKKKLFDDCEKVCKDISTLRKNKTKYIINKIVETLKDLGMKDVKFDIKIEKKSVFTLSGYDEVSFLISTNKGQELKPLDKIASGGEMSRIMIAIKNLISDSYNIETFVFDEIDNGVSGRTAHKVGEKLANIGIKHQILCITHLPQIAAMADNHIMIYKETKNNETQTYINKLEEDGQVEELARLIGGAEITKSTIKAAQEMKELANNIKSDLQK